MANAVVIMAAGLGTRMRSERIKVLHEVAGRSMILWCVETALALNPDRIVLVLGHQRQAVEAVVRAAYPNAPISIAVQEQQLGTAHAVLCAKEALADFSGNVFILSGDVPTLSVETLKRLDASSADVAMFGMRLASGANYGRLIFDDGGLAEIVEARDCTPEQLKVRDVNSGIYRIQSEFLFDALQGVSSNNAQGEFYLTDLIAESRKRGLSTEAIVLEGDAAAELEGVNDRIDLAKAEARIQKTLVQAHMRAGVTFLAPERVRLEAGVQIGADSVIEPDVALLQHTVVGAKCVIGQGAILKNAKLADGVLIKPYSHIEDSQIGDHAQVGPFARLRPGSILDRDVRLGNFVETKKSHLHEGVKAGHLSYLGDADIGAGTNIGAGTITCNYDGVSKFQTVIGKDVFIGSDSQLVAPVVVEDGAYVGAGTTVTDTVNAGALAISRVRQRQIEGWVERKNQAREQARKESGSKK